MIPRHLEAAGAVLHLGDVLDALRADENGYPFELGYGPRLIPDASIDSVVTDPPYGLEFMGEKWDSFKSGTVQAKVTEGMDTSHPFRDGSTRIRYGTSDTSAFQEWCAEWAAECFRALKPGGYILAFGGTRMWHRLASGIEDAGFEIRDSIAWIYAQGFPKSLNVSAAMESYLADGPVEPVGSERVHPEGILEVTRFVREARDRAGVTNKQIDALFGTNGMAGHWTTGASQPAVPSQRQWAALKEFLGFDDSMDDLAARIGSIERPEDWGQGGADSGPFLDALRRNPDAVSGTVWGTALKPAIEPIVVGRKPLAGTNASNILQYGTGALNIEGCRVGDDADGRWPTNVIVSHAPELDAHGNIVGDACANGCVDGCPVLEVDRQSGTSTSRRAVMTSKPGDIYGGGKGLPAYTAVAGYDDAGGGSRMFPAFRYQAKASTRERPRKGDVVHPTVKPVDLMRWLCRLVTPPGGRILEPFAGSGTTGEAALVEGFEVVMTEREPKYAGLIEKRIRRDLQATLFADMFDGLDDGAAS